jgi:hypothetical protein
MEERKKESETRGKKTVVTNKTYQQQEYVRICQQAVSISKKPDELELTVNDLRMSEMRNHQEYRGTNNGNKLNPKKEKKYENERK